jgi:glucose/mannose transport system substrate-binding protein
MAALLASVFAAAAFAPAAGNAVELKVNYDWSAPPEVAAINVLKDHLAALGVTWQDFSVVQHDTGANVSIINMVAGGKAPDVFLANDPGLFRDLKAQGLGVPLDAIFAKAGATDNFPAVVKKSLTVDGEIVKVPADIDLDGIIYYNKEVAAKAGVDPASWKSMDDLWAAFDQIKATGVIPIAIGSQKWQEAYVFHSLMAAYASDIFDGFYAPKPDTATFDSAGLRKVLDEVRQVQQHLDPGSANRDWNVTADLVVTGKALLQLHGSWMKGEFATAGKVPGKDYGCILIPGSQSVSVNVDSWGMIKSSDPAVTDAQEKFATVSVDPAVQAEFAVKKGSNPAVLNAPTDNLDECNKIVLDTIKDPTKTHQSPRATTDIDWFQATWEVVDRFWTDPTMTDDQAIAEFKKAYDAIF